MAAGMIVAGVLHSFWNPRHKRLRTIVFAIAFQGVCEVALAHAPHLAVAMSLPLRLRVGIVSNNVPMVSLLQEASDPARMGRVMSLNAVASLAWRRSPLPS